VKYEEVYLRDYATVPETIKGLGRYFEFYNRERLHQSLDYKTPEAVYWLMYCMKGTNTWHHKQILAD
jgi:putative transposase